ncbi:LysM peptidoglycan-binding domain-containing protein [Heliobacterium chlorum]|uniref:LysM peptidoglycan-binding domain-containing protein n=1 Tax=Heliobacterium chlorum TaxID=2698 RepID=A0ABR7T242_HELCL|nr:LysM domain-containing protein [Heliobacterium chlorum]MBC9784849.1 LysM peptidoglycan-binding domain-containing protein [Heliobacterium chlorum]
MVNQWVERREEGDLVGLNSLDLHIVTFDLGKVDREQQRVGSAEAEVHLLEVLQADNHELHLNVQVQVNAILEPERARTAGQDETNAESQDQIASALSLLDQEIPPGPDIQHQEQLLMIPIPFDRIEQKDAITAREIEALSVLHVHPHWVDEELKIDVALAAGVPQELDSDYRTNDYEERDIRLTGEGFPSQGEVIAFAWRAEKTELDGFVELRGQTIVDIGDESPLDLLETVHIVEYGAVLLGEPQWRSDGGQWELVGSAQVLPVEVAQNITMDEESAQRVVAQEAVNQGAPAQEPVLEKAMNQEAVQQDSPRQEEVVQEAIYQSEDIQVVAGSEADIEEAVAQVAAAQEGAAQELTVQECIQDEAVQDEVLQDKVLQDEVREKLSTHELNDQETACSEPFPASPYADAFLSPQSSFGSNPTAFDEVAATGNVNDFPITVPVMTGEVPILNQSVEEFEPTWSEYPSPVQRIESAEYPAPPVLGEEAEYPPAKGLELQFNEEGAAADELQASLYEQAASLYEPPGLFYPQPVVLTDSASPLGNKINAYEEQATSFEQQVSAAEEQSPGSEEQAALLEEQPDVLEEQTTSAGSGKPVTAYEEAVLPELSITTSDGENYIGYPGYPNPLFYPEMRVMPPAPEAIDYPAVFKNSIEEISTPSSAEPRESDEHFSLMQYENQDDGSSREIHDQEITEILEQSSQAWPPVESQWSPAGQMWPIVEHPWRPVVQLWPPEEGEWIRANQPWSTTLTEVAASIQPEIAGDIPASQSPHYQASIDVESIARDSIAEESVAEKSVAEGSTAEASTVEEFKADEALIERSVAEESNDTKHTDTESTDRESSDVESSAEISSHEVTTNEVTPDVACTNEVPVNESFLNELPTKEASTKDVIMEDAAAITVAKDEIRRAQEEMIITDDEAILSHDKPIPVDIAPVLNEIQTAEEELAATEAALVEEFLIYDHGDGRNDITSSVVTKSSFGRERPLINIEGRRSTKNETRTRLEDLVPPTPSKESSFPRRIPSPRTSRLEPMPAPSPRTGRRLAQTASTPAAKTEFIESPQIVETKPAEVRRFPRPSAPEKSRNLDVAGGIGAASPRANVGEQEKQKGKRPEKKWKFIVIQPGDTISSIARRNRVSEESIRTLNKLGPNDPIEAGQSIMVPRNA